MDKEVKEWQRRVDETAEEREVRLDKGTTEKQWFWNHFLIWKSFKFLIFLAWTEPPVKLDLLLKC